MKTIIRTIHIFFSISAILFSMSTEDTNIGLLMESGKGALSMSSNLAITPQKPSSDKDMGEIRYLNASLLLPSGIQFSIGNSCAFTISPLLKDVPFTWIVRKPSLP